MLLQSLWDFDQNQETLTAGAERGASERAFSASDDDDLGEGLAVSERAGQDAAPPITAPPAFADTLSGRFQACFLPCAASPNASSACTSWGDRSEISRSAIATAGDGEEREGGASAAGPSGSAPLTRGQGWRAANEARGERDGEEGSAAAAAAMRQRRGVRDSVTNAGTWPAMGCIEGKGI